MDTETLVDIGLTKGEADVYVTLLKLGNTTSGNIIKLSKVSRSKVYDVLERLKQKGLATEMIKENVRYFEAADPKRILDYLHIKKEDIEKKIKTSEKVVHNLTAMRNLQLEKQEVKVYIGIEGLKTIYNQILEELQKGDEYLAFGIGEPEIQREEIALFMRKFHMQRAEKKVRARILMHPEAKPGMSYFSTLKYYLYKYTKV